MSYACIDTVCGGQTRVLDSRPDKSDGTTVRIRVCTRCEKRFQTKEFPSSEQFSPAGYTVQKKKRKGKPRRRNYPKTVR